MSFTTLGLSDPILKALADHGYETPTAIQSEAIPAVLAGRDLMAAAQTGTGKTAGFTLPILERLSGGQRASANQVRCLILTPTRELAAQVAESVETYGKYLPLTSAVVFGGVKINPQMMRLRRGADILVATPGRLLDLYNQNAVKFNQLEVLVLDEADRMLDMGFIHDIKRILAALPKKRQNLMFSATFSDEIRALAKGMINDPLEVSVTPRNAAAKSVKQWIHPVDKKDKAAVLKHLIKTLDWAQVLVFSKTKHGANKLTKYLEDGGIKATAIHGNKSQGARTKALADFKSGAARVLVATDIAARGLDIDQLPQVVNFDLPNVPEDYVHRIGRTGRAGASGEAISLVSADEFPLLSDIERLVKELLPREYVEGFKPVNDLPESRLNTRPFKPKPPRVEHVDGQRPVGGDRRPRSPGARPGGHSQHRNDSNFDARGARSGASGRSAGAKPATAAGAENNGNRAARPQGSGHGAGQGQARRNPAGAGSGAGGMANRSSRAPSGPR